MFSVFEFSELSPLQLFRVLQLRSFVFVVEQACAYQDPDENDLNALHVLYSEGDRLLAYARILPPVQDHSPKIGRVLVHPDARKFGLGRKLMKYCVQQSLEKYKGQDIMISAQCYLDAFYSSLGFVKEGLVYDEDGIPHQKMRLSFNR